MNHIISLVLGDWSGDGHSKTDIVNISSNLSKKEIEKAYSLGTKKIGFDLINDVCADYEDNNLSAEHWEILKKFGYKEDNIPGDPVDEKDDHAGILVWSDGFVDLYLFIVKLGNDTFQGKILEEKDNPTIRIGGYGLFY